MTVQDTVVGESDSSGHHGRGRVTVQDTMGMRSDSSGYRGRGE